jgi:hypothetical protein
MHIPKTLFASLLTASFLCVAPLSLSGCEQESDLENAVEDVGESMEEGAEDVGDAVEDALD